MTHPLPPGKLLQQRPLKLQQATLDRSPVLILYAEVAD
jgi:hypothetical protein